MKVTHCRSKAVRLQELLASVMAVSGFDFGTRLLHTRFESLRIGLAAQLPCYRISFTVRFDSVEFMCCGSVSSEAYLTLKEVGEKAKC